jgi:hypothetical protein
MESTPCVILLFTTPGHDSPENCLISRRDFSFSPARHPEGRNANTTDVYLKVIDMAYLAKLAKRISCTRLLTGAIVFTVGGCGQADNKDFLDPYHNQIVPVVASLRIQPKLGIVPANQEIQFTATGISTTGNVIPVTVVWSVLNGGTITTDGRFMADRGGQFQVKAYVTSSPGIQDEARAAVWERPTDVLQVFVSPDSTVVAPDEPLKFDATTLLANGTTSQAGAVVWEANGGQVSATGLFSASTAGDYVVSASVENGAKGSSTILVRTRSRSLTGISVTPAAVTVASGATQQFTGTGAFSDGTTSSLTSVSWSSTGGTISHNGLYAAGSVGGVFTVIGFDKSGVFADTARVTVQAPVAVDVTVLPGSASLVPGASQHFAAQATLSDGTTRTTAVNWQVTGGTINLNGDYTAGSTLGSYRVIATVPGTSLADTAEVTIGQPAATLTQVIVNPSAVSLAAGATSQFSVAGVWSDGTSTAPAVTWSATGGTVSSSGFYTAGSVSGTYRVIARASNGVADTSAVTVASAALASFSISPSTISVPAGGTQQFNRTGTLSDGSSYIPGVTWSATGGTMGSSGVYTAGSNPGTYNVIGTVEGGVLADTAFVTVTAPTVSLTSLFLSPTSASLQPATTRQFAVSATWSNGANLVPPVAWSATGGSVSSNGLYTAGPTAGNYRVIANYSSGALADTSAVTVNVVAPTLSSLAISPASTSLQVSGTKQFTVSGTWSDGSTSVPAVTWTATGGTITNGGLYAAGTTAGSYQVIATQVGGTKTDTANVTIGSAVLTAVTTTPATLILVPSASAAFTASGHYSNGSTGSVTVDWSATGGAITSGGVYTAGATQGTFRVIAVEQGGTLADTSVVTISGAAATLSSLALSPSAVAMFTGGQQQFTAIGLYSNGSSAALPATWSATGGTVSSAGLYAAGSGAGTFRVIGTDPVSGKADTSTVTISLAPPPGTYVAVLAQDWNTYADKNALAAAGIVGVDAQSNVFQLPTLPTTDFYDLVPDPIFGKVVRYNGGPQLNTYPVIVEALNSGTAGNNIWISLTSSGTILTVKNDPIAPTITETFTGLGRANWLQAVNVGGLAGAGQANGQPSALIRALGPVNTGVGALPQFAQGATLMGGATGVKARKQVGDNVQGRVASHEAGLGYGKGLSDIWVRQFVRFSPNYTTEGNVGGSGAASHKMMFFRYLASGRHYWVLDGLRGMLHSLDTSPGGTLVSQGALPVTNVGPLNSNYFLPDADPLIKVRCGTGIPNPCGDGDGQWYEIVMHHKNVAERGEGTLYWRKYTVGGAVNPGPWSITGWYKQLAPGQTWSPVQSYDMGVNRNRQWDEAMFIYWGPYAVVDGSKYPNPWSLPQ